MTTYHVLYRDSEQQWHVHDGPPLLTYSQAAEVMVNEYVGPGVFTAADVKIVVELNTVPLTDSDELRRLMLHDPALKALYHHAYRLGRADGMRYMP